MDCKDYKPEFDKIHERLSAIDKTLTKNTTIVEEHERRSTQLENRVTPIELYLANVDGIIKFFKFIGVLAAIAEAVRLCFF